MTTVTYTATVVITAEDQQEVFDAFSALINACINVANDYPTVEIDVEELDPQKLNIE